MSPATQVKVLRALQSGEFRRIGSNRHIKADIRVIAATNKDLREEVQRTRFREDLYYRIAVIEIHMPPLRERTDDIPFLVEHFLRVNAYGGRERLQVTPEAMVCLTKYRWPGNIRELRNVIERLSVLADSQVMTVDTLPPAIAKSAQEPSERGAPPGRRAALRGMASPTSRSTTWSATTSCGRWSGTAGTRSAWPVSSVSTRRRFTISCVATASPSACGAKAMWPFPRPSPSVRRRP